MTAAGRRGSVRQDSSGRWCFVVDVSVPGGPRRQARRRGFHTKKAAQAALTETLGDLNARSYIEPSRLTLREYIADRWLPVVAGELRPSTLHSYQRNLRLHVLPRLGAVPLQALDPASLQALYANLARSGRRDHLAGHGLSPRTVNYIHTILRSALQTAVDWDLLQRNPAVRARPPKRTAAGNRHEQIRTWSRQELSSFLEATRQERLYPLWLLMATTGLRRGEALGLNWDSVDLSAGRISIRRSLVDVTTVASGSEPVYSDPKTLRGSRIVGLDTATQRALRGWRTRLDEEHALFGLAATDNLVFTNEDGRPLHPDRLARFFVHRVRKTGLPVIRLHDLRHTWATLALESGVHPKVVSERLGHSTITITLTIYSHVLPAMDTEAAERVAGLVLGPEYMVCDQAVTNRPR